MKKDKDKIKIRKSAPSLECLKWNINITRRANSKKRIEIE